MTFVLADTSIKFASMVTQATQNWLFTRSGLFLATGTSWCLLIGVILFVIIGFRFAVDIWAGGTGEGAFPFAIYRLARWLVVLWLLRGYNTPLYGGVSFHNLIPEEARQLLLVVTDNSLKTALGTVNGIQTQAAKQADWWNPGEQFAATLTGWMVAAFNGIMILLSCGGYILEAIAVTVGPLSIPWLAFEWSAFLFWDWVQFMISASMFQVIAVILVNIWSNIMVEAGPDILAVEPIQMSILFCGLMIALVLSAIGIGWIVTALYGKGASAAANLANSAAGAAVSMARRF